MRRARLLLFLLFAWAAALGPTPALAVEVKQVSGASGVVAWLAEDHINPIVSMKFSFRGAAALDPADRKGLAAMVAGLLDEGAGDIRSRAFRRELEDLSITLRFDAGRDIFSGTLKTLSENRERAFQLLALALNSPRFDAEPVERVRGQLLANLRQVESNPSDISINAMMQTVFAGHPYADNPDGTAEGVAAVTAEDLRGFVHRRLARDNLAVGVVGDIGPDELKALLDRTFGALPAKATPWALPETQAKGAGKTVVVNQPIPQSIIALAGQGIKRKDPDYYAAQLVNHALGGGGFTSRLYDEVREKRGLAYSVYSALSPMDAAALVVAGGATANGDSGKTLSLIQAEWRRMGKEGPSANELARAKTYLTGAFPLNFVSSDAVAGILVGMQLHGLGPDYLEKRNDLINRVTLEDAKRVAARLFGGEPAVVVVGEPKDAKKGVKKDAKKDATGR